MPLTVNTCEADKQ